MEKIYKTLFLTLLLLSGCAKEYHLQYNSPEEGSHIKPLNINTEISVNVENLEGITTKKPFISVDKWFPEFEKEIKEAIKKDLRNSLLAVVNEVSPKVHVSMDVSFKYRERDNFGGLFLVGTLNFLGGLIGASVASITHGEGVDCSVSLGYAIIGMIAATTCAYYLVPTEKSICNIEIGCTVKGENGKLIKSYESEVEIKRNFGSISTRKYSLSGSKNTIILSIKEALKIIKFLIGEDRNEILKSAQKYQEK